MLPGSQGAARLWEREGLCAMAQRKRIGGKSRSCRSGHSRAFARNFASPCLRGGVVDFAIFDQGKQDSCSQ